MTEKKSTLPKLIVFFVLFLCLCVLPCGFLVFVYKMSSSQNIDLNFGDEDSVATLQSGEEEPDDGDEDIVTGGEGGGTSGNSEDDTVGTPDKFAVIIGGASHDETHFGWFRDSSRQAYDLFVDLGYKDGNIFYLFEGVDEDYVDMSATTDSFASIVSQLSEEVSKSDMVTFVFIGHGMNDGVSSFFEFTDFLLKDSDVADYLGEIGCNKKVVIMSQCNSGGFIDDLSGEGMVIITSTKADESNMAAFIEPLLTALSGEGDKDSDGKVSTLEAFNYASENVQQQYTSNNWGNLVEHALLDSDGDGVGSVYPVSGADKNLAGSTFL